MTATYADMDGVEIERTPLESRADVEPLEALHAQRRQIVGQLAPLRALHGPGGTWDARRKQMVEACKIRARMAARERGEKVTETYIDAEGHADPQYFAFLDQAERDKIEYVNLDNQVQELEERIRNREFSLTAYSAEIRLGR
jgi:hypothetical protein